MRQVAKLALYGCMYQQEMDQSRRAIERASRTPQQHSNAAYARFINIDLLKVVC